MVKVGAQIRLSSGKGPDRDGVVTAVTGSILRVRWPLASSGDKASAAARKSVATKQTAPKASAKKAATRKAAPERRATKHTASANKETTTGGPKKSKGVKRPSR